MLDYLILVTLVSEVAIFTKIERIIYGTWVTPFFLLAAPYTIVALAAFFFVSTLGFEPLYTESVIIWIAGLFLFFLCGLIIALPLNKTIRIKTKGNRGFRYEKESEHLGLVLAWIAILVMSFALLASLRSLGWQQIGTDDFAESYGSSWHGHVRNFSMGVAIFLIGTAKRRDIFKIITVFIMFGLYILYPVKSWVYIPMIAGFIYRFASDRAKPSIAKFVVFIFMGLFFFHISYLIKFGVANAKSLFDFEVYEFITRHFVQYLFSGVLTLGKVVEDGLLIFHGDPQKVFSPFLNLYSFVFGAKLTNPIETEFITISTYYDFSANVHTFFGNLLINLNFIPAIVYLICFSLIIYGLFVITTITKNCWLEVVWVFSGALLSLGWFNSYFIHLPAIEVPAYFILVGIFFTFFGGILKGKISHRKQKIAELK